MAAKWARPYVRDATRGASLVATGPLGRGALGASDGRPSMKRTPLPGTAGTRKPGLTMPARFTGSVALHPDALAGALLAADAAQGVDGLGQGVLLADEAGDEAAAADDAARLEASQRAQDVAPGQGEALAREEVAEDDAVALQEQVAPAISASSSVSIGAGRRRVDEGPAAGGAAAGEEAAGGRTADARTRRLPECADAAGELAQALEAVGGDEAPGDELAQAALDVGAQAPGAVDDLVEEEGAALPAAARGSRRRRRSWAPAAVESPRTAASSVGEVGAQGERDRASRAMA